MTTITRSRLPIPALTAIALVAALMLVFVSPAASQSPEARDADLLSALERGEIECSDLGGEDYAAIGELVMGRMVASVQAHEEMDELMARMMGQTGRDRMHEVMGQRFAGCGQPGLRSGFGQMMGVIGMMGGRSGGLGPAGMMGGGYGPQSSGDVPDGGYGSGSMMGFDRGSGDDDDVEIWMVVTMLALVLAVAIGAYIFARSTKDRSDPLDLLAERFARGEISLEEYTERRQLLQGGRS